MSNVKHGYGIYRWVEGSVYYGEYIKGNRHGHGHLRWPNGDEYCGEWKNSVQWGEGIKQEKGQLYIVKYDEGEL
jgi:hypothetical protein